MTELELGGLRADLPLGAMAAFGCLRICQRLPGFSGVRLAWTNRGGVDHAVLHGREGMNREALIAGLVSDVRRAAARPELRWKDQIKTSTPAEFHETAREVVERATAREREAADWFAAFGSELEAGRDERIESTPFDMSVARQRFLADALKLAGGLAEDRARGRTAADAYAEALFGPWEYADDQHSLGWDPSTMKLGAFTPKAPTGMANAGVRAAVWLAFESLPLFPCFFADRLEVRSFQRNGRELVFCWPVWRAPIGLETLSFLLAWEGLTKTTLSEAELAARGIVGVYRSERFKPNKYLASFRVPELAFSAEA